jgi:hypothetical protein
MSVVARLMDWLDRMATVVGMWSRNIRLVVLVSIDEVHAAHWNGQDKLVKSYRLIEALLVGY